MARPEAWRALAQPGAPPWRVGGLVRRQRARPRPPQNDYFRAFSLQNDDVRAFNPQNDNVRAFNQVILPLLRRSARDAATSFLTFLKEHLLVPAAHVFKELWSPSHLPLSDPRDIISIL